MTKLLRRQVQPKITPPGVGAPKSAAHVSTKGNSVECPTCGETTGQVIDSRPTVEGWIRRRRVCSACKCRFSTIEIAELPHTITHYTLRKVASELSRIKNSTDYIEQLLREPPTDD